MPPKKYRKYAYKKKTGAKYKSTRKKLSAFKGKRKTIKKKQTYKKKNTISRGVRRRRAPRAPRIRGGSARSNKTTQNVYVTTTEQAKCCPPTSGGGAFPPYIINSGGGGYGNPPPVTNKDPLTQIINKYSPVAGKIYDLAKGAFYPTNNPEDNMSVDNIKRRTRNNDLGPINNVQRGFNEAFGRYTVPPQHESIPEAAPAAGGAPSSGGTPYKGAADPFTAHGITDEILNAQESNFDRAFTDAWYKQYKREQSEANQPPPQQPEQHYVRPNRVSISDDIPQTLNPDRNK